MEDVDAKHEARRAQDKLDQMREERYKELTSWVKTIDTTLLQFKDEVNRQYIELRSLIIGVSTREVERHNFTHWLRENSVIAIMFLGVFIVLTTLAVAKLGFSK